jgi:hypothetical protein
MALSGNPVIMAAEPNKPDMPACFKNSRRGLILLIILPPLFVMRCGTRARRSGAFMHPAEQKSCPRFFRSAQKTYFVVDANLFFRTAPCQESLHCSGALNQAHSGRTGAQKRLRERKS